ncbi:hypothetical protein ACFQI3_09230 [Hansschlegelia quercus]|uniref:Uncharacterized protein n=1 Tax=Hansschlegelia quercus TaxID=2528245 RepID=A0A4Q9GLH8_9HYPH|nr:hypothetical protein [Hansschlegelia quercus]TBN54261.1 hypothetical protein EYR15_05305 [Hansschlegelia quercus]
MAEERGAASSNRTGQRLASYILPASGTMIGICTTLVGLVKIVESRSGPSVVDEYGAAIAVAFLFSALFSYLSIRLSEGAPTLGRRCERVADFAFLLGLVCLVGLIGLFAFEAI